MQDSDRLAITASIATAFLVLVFGIALSMGAGPRSAEHGSGEITVVGAWAAETIGQSTTSVAYLSIANGSDGPDRLIAARTTAAQVAELHNTVFDGGLMRMTHVNAIEVPSQETVSLEPGGYHVMLIGVAEPLVAGQTVRLELEFEQAGTVIVDAPVRTRGQGAPAEDHMGHGDHGDHGGADGAAPDQTPDQTGETQTDGTGQDGL